MSYGVGGGGGFGVLFITGFGGVSNEQEICKQRVKISKGFFIMIKCFGLLIRLESKLLAGASVIFSIRYVYFDIYFKRLPNN